MNYKLSFLKLFGGKSFEIFFFIACSSYRFLLSLVVLGCIFSVLINLSSIPEAKSLLPRIMTQNKHLFILFVFMPSLITFMLLMTSTSLIVRKSSRYNLVQYVLVGSLLFGIIYQTILFSDFNASFKYRIAPSRSSTLASIASKDPHRFVRESWYPYFALRPYLKGKTLILNSYGGLSKHLLLSGALVSEIREKDYKQQIGRKRAQKILMTLPPRWQLKEDKEIVVVPSDSSYVTLYQNNDTYIFR